MRSMFFAAKRIAKLRVLPCLLALIMLLSTVPMTVFSVDAGEEPVANEIAVPTPSELIYDHDTLKITLDGEETYALSLYEHEKIEISAAGVSEQASYQWQIQHNEKDDLWIDIYDATDPSLSLTAALIGGVLRDDGTAKVRCRAYTQDCAYLTRPFTVALSQEPPLTVGTVSPITQSLPSFMADASNEFVMVKIEYVQYDFRRDANGDLVVDAENKPVLDEGKQAFTPYIATIKSGTSLNTTVHFPTMIGYDSFFEDEDTPSTSYEISLTEVNADIIYTVKYKPALVDYSVRYYFQNIYDDLYVEDTDLKVNDTGFTGATPPDSILQKEVPGFTALYYQPDAIAADGSTVFEVYYERNYYLMEFDCNGGYGAETIYVRYGSYVSVPQPVKAGYVFSGWDLVKSENPDDPITEGDGTVEPLPSSLPPYNMGYKAVWSTSKTTYTVVYWRENADDDGYSYWGSRRIGANADGTPNGTVNSNEHVSGLNHSAATGLREAEYFTYNATKTAEEEAKRTDLASDGKVIVEGDGSTVVHVYYSRNVYTLQFNIGSNTFTPPATHLHTDGNCTYKLICGFDQHVHSGECVSTLTCTIPAHDAHTKECLSCEIEEHEHSHDCCTIEPHEHTDACCAIETHNTHNAITCYTTQTGYQKVGTSGDDYERVRRINNPTAATVYKYRDGYGWNPTYYNYYYDGETWYYLGIGSEYCGIGGVYFSDWSYDTVQYDDTLERICHEHNVTDCQYTKCGKITHQHDDVSCSCSKPEHEHSEAEGCYKDEIHSHTDACYSWTCGSSAHTHTSECYSSCTKPECYVQGTGSNKKFYIKAKYNQTIGDIWPTSANFPGLYGWKVEGSSSIAVSKKINMTPDLCDNDDNVCEIDDNTDGTSYTVNLYYMFESFDQTSPVNGNDRRQYKEVYYDKSALYYQVAKSSSNEFSQKDITGMTPVGVVREHVQNREYNNFLYYTRARVDLKFHNINTTVATVQDLMYEFPLSGVKVNENAASAFEPPYPSVYEPGAYEFIGWYTTPDCFDGTEVDWDSMVMPDSDLELYAKWTPILRNVTFYSAYSDIAKDENDTSDKVYHFMKATGIPHGHTVGSTYYDVPEHPEDLNPATTGGSQADLYDFVGWFYMDEDNKKRFAPDSMEVTRDLVLFAEWQTSIDTTYEIKYALRDAVSAENVPSRTNYPAGTLIADTLFAHSSVGKTKTFSAKGLGELDADFQKKFFPTVNTHSILMEPEDDKNKYTFEYVYDDAVYYKVRYVDFATRTEIEGVPSFVDSTQEAIITVKFRPIKGYIPQNFYIRKALAYDGNATADSVIEENVITFYYVKDTEHGLYSIEYYLENVDSTDSNDPENYSQYESIVGSDDNGQKVTATIRTYEGFTHVPSLNTVITYNADGKVANEKKGDAAGNPPSGNVDYTGLTIKIYYKRNLYPYIIEYREYGAPDTAPALWSEAGNKKFDKDIDHTAEASLSVTEGDDTFIYEYYLPDATVEERTKTMTIRVANAGEENPNKLIFYYIKKQVTVIYEEVCTVPTLTNFGYVSFYSESAAVASALSGSDAMPDSGFRFVGWYTDADCKNPVNPDWRYNGTTPDPNGTKLKPGTLDPNVDEVRYYALFEPICSSMTITKTVKDNGTEIDPTDHFLFRVQGQSNNSLHIDLIVSIQGSGSITLTEVPVGDYFVTELTEWSWDYSTTDAIKEVKVTTETPGNATFENNSKNSNWLSGETAKDNEFN